MIRLVLPSDSSFDYFPNNNTPNFNVKLANAIHLTNEWQIGLNEIILPNQICNIRKNKNEIVIYRKTEVGATAALQSVNFPKRTMYLPPGCYQSVTEIINSINKKIGYDIARKNKKKVKKISVVYNSKSNRVTVVPARNYGIHFGSDIRQIFGFHSLTKSVNYSNHYVNFSKRTGELHASIGRTINNLIVYNDLVGDTRFGHTMTPLLRIVNMSKELISGAGSTSIPFDPVHFFPLKFNQFDTINIQLHDQKGELIQFESGEVVVILTLKPKAI